MGTGHLQSLQSLALAAGVLAPGASLDAGPLPSPLQPALAALAQRLTEPAAAPAPATLPLPDSTAAVPGQDLLEEEQRRLAARLVAQQRRTAAAAQRAADVYERAQGQQAEVAAAVQGLAEQLGTLATGDPASLSLLSVAVPETISARGAQLLQGLAAYLGGAPGGAAGQGAAGQGAQPAREEHQHQREFARLQDAVQLAAAEGVTAQATLAGAQAELAYLERHSSGAGADPELLGRSVEELEGEVQHLQRRLEAGLERVRAAAAQAALGHAAAAVAQQGAARLEAAQRRCAAKQQALDLLVKHVARQLLLAEVLRQEQAGLEGMQGLVQAALGDCTAVLQAAEQRLDRVYPAGCDRQAQGASAAAGEQQQQQSQQPQQPEPQLLQALTEAAGPGCSAAEAPQAVAEQLLQLRAGLQEQAARLQREVLPAQRGAFAALHRLAFSGTDASSPEMLPAGLQERMGEAEAAAAGLKQAATAVLVEVTQRQQQGQAHQRQALREAVMIDFWTRPERLAKRAGEQQRTLQA